MKPQSRHIIHLGINVITIPAPIITRQSSLMFQQAILSSGLDFTKVENRENQIVLVREIPAHLQMAVSSLESQAGQLLVVSNQGPLSLFIQETEAVITAFENVWPATNRQIIKGDSTIRELYETTSDHAFQELWEKRLKQPSELLGTFGRPIRGGGLRFVMDPLPQEDDPVLIEVKIESFLQDTTKIFVETQFTWLKPTLPGSKIEAKEWLERINSYIEKEVQAFLSLGGI